MFGLRHGLPIGAICGDSPGPGEPGAFAPSDIASLLLWWDGSDTGTLTLSGAEVTQIDDKSGNGYHGVRSGTGPDSGTVTINSLNALEFASDKLTVASLPVTASNHFFVVGNMDAGGGTDSSMMGFNDGSADNFDWRWRGRTTGEFDASYRALSGNTTGNMDEAGLPTYHGAVHIFELRHDATGDTAELYVDGAQKAISAIHTQSGAHSGTFFLMADNAGANGLNGDVGEVLIFDAALSGDDLTNVRAYLQEKWGTP